MASGLMSLAYMAEMAIVFNVAYFELNKSRYINGPREAASALEKTIKETNPGPAQKAAWIKGRTPIIDRLDKLFSSNVSTRQHTWYVEGADGHAPHKNNWAKIFGFFLLERDKELCQHALILSGLALTIMTIRDHICGDASLFGWALYGGLTFGVATFIWFLRFLIAKISIWIPVAVGAISVAAVTAHASEKVPSPSDSEMSAWWFFFLIYLCSLLAPAFCVAVGRRTRTHLMSCINDTRREFEALKAIWLKVTETKTAT